MTSDVVGLVIGSWGGDGTAEGYHCELPMLMAVDRSDLLSAMRHCLIISLALFVALLPKVHAGDLNALVLEVVEEMPKGGGYDASQAAVDRLAESVGVLDGEIRQADAVGQRSFCSGATYLVLLRVIERLRATDQLRLSPEALALWADLDVKDGEKVFGRWNANGPGAAKLFADLKCGRNFTSFDEAKPGDFLKIWWSDEIGGKERGHLVIYLGSKDGMVSFWSSNQPNGYGVKSVARTKIRRALFGRLERSAALENVAELSPKDAFLADMLSKSFTWNEVARRCGLKE